MDIKDYLKTKQHIVYQILKNSFQNQKTSHAYILNGSKGTPLLDIAMFMAQSFVCLQKDEDQLACEHCLYCQKIKNQTYADFKLIQGENLKTNITLSIQEDFNKSSMENKNIKIYIIHQIEKAPVSSLNKLLKFIEEPSSNIVAIFTTHSIHSVLPTIVSRCQTITLKEFKIQDLVDFLMENSIAEEDAWLISKISNNAEENLKILQQQNYQDIKTILGQSLKYLSQKNDYFIVDFQLNSLKILTENTTIELFLDMLEVCLLEAIIYKEDTHYKPHFYGEEIVLISKNYQHIDTMIEDITKAKIDLLSNANKNLVFDKLLINLLRR